MKALWYDILNDLMNSIIMPDPSVANIKLFNLSVRNLQINPKTFSM